jgi:hypothetical protein
LRRQCEVRRWEPYLPASLITERDEPTHYSACHNGKGNSLCRAIFVMGYGRG